jgi:hypothetical protein
VKIQCIFHQQSECKIYCNAERGAASGGGREKKLMSAFNSSPSFFFLRSYVFLDYGNKGESENRKKGQKKTMKKEGGDEEK